MRSASTVRLFTIASLPLALLAACSQEREDAGAQGDADPASEQALNEDLMTDTDLAGSNEGNSALSGSGDRSIPEINRTPEAISAARLRAAELVGGTDAMRPAKAPHALASGDAGTPAMRKAAQTILMRGGTNCMEGAKQTTAWAAKLPAAFPVYPRGNTQEGAGNDDGGCSLRAVTFLTPVPLKDVLAFYNTRAAAAGYSVDHATAGGDHILAGTKGDAGYTIYARTVDGVTEVDLMASAP